MKPLDKKDHETDKQDRNNLHDLDLTLNRSEIGANGVFGFIPELNIVTLEHSYQQKDGSWAAKVPAGKYHCVKGLHTLPSGLKLITWEITGVPGHTGILFHPGNYDQDSAGCVLVGEDRVGNMITHSELTLMQFKGWMEDRDFDITINNP